MDALSRGGWMDALSKLRVVGLMHLLGVVGWMR